MSLILEALRKSEAERRRGQVPGLHAELPPPHATRAAAFPPWAWWLLACTLLLAAGWLLRASLPLQPAPAAPAPDAGATMAAATTSAADSVVTQPRFRPPPSAAITAEAPTPAAPPRAGATATNTLPRSASASQAVATAPAANVPAPAGPAPSAPPSATATGALLQLSDLSPEERKSLPPLKLSMHLWNPDPAKRFVIVDGNRVGEGDRVGDAVVAAITSDGVELDWNGRRLQVPIH